MPAAAGQLVKLATIAFGGALAVALVTGIPTDIVNTSLFTRMTPIYPDQLFFWVTTSVLSGLLLASYFLAVPGRSGAASGVGGGLLGFLAVGCPVCNKLIVGILGVAGAMEFFAPAQPFLGALGMLLLMGALALRIRDIRRPTCPTPQPAASP